MTLMFYMMHRTTGTTIKKMSIIRYDIILYMAL